MHSTSMVGKITSGGLGKWSMCPFCLTNKKRTEQEGVRGRHGVKQRGGGLALLEGEPEDEPHQADATESAADHHAHGR